MRGMNKMMVVGRVGQAPELRTSKAGVAWMKLSVATNRAVKKDDGWEEETDWHRVHVFGDAAERCMRFLRQGSVVGVEGAMTYEKWTDEEGVKRLAPKIIADRIHFLADLREADAVAPATAEASA